MEHSTVVEREHKLAGKEEAKFKDYGLKLKIDWQKPGILTIGTYAWRRAGLKILKLMR